ncbi:MAG: cytochrome c [Gemmatimonadetes bacterium]|nr:cytochrome c [Gemmatimonadota bacterium]NNM32774.1 cytochrome c [Gemmatimonadota bacterium]
MWLSACSAGDGRGGAERPADLWDESTIARGEDVFRRHCAICHGERGDGRGARAGSLSSTPRDFTNPLWRDGAEPEALFHTISHGVAGTAMPPWASALSEEERWDVVAHVLNLGRE